MKTYVDSKLYLSTQIGVTEITPFEFMKIVKSIKNTKSVGLDDITSRVLKLATDVLSIHIAYIINNSITQNIFPEELKHAKVVPVYKKGAVNDPHNDRPISVLPCISKVFEKHICNQLGPLMFLLSINDLPLYLHHSSTDMYDDDSTLYTSDISVSNLETILQKDLNHVLEWCYINKMNPKVILCASEHICSIVRYCFRSFKQL